MAQPWAGHEIGPSFAGLLRRRQRVLQAPEFFEALTNVSLYSGALSKRGGVRSLLDSDEPVAFNSTVRGLFPGIYRHRTVVLFAVSNGRFFRVNPLTVQTVIGEVSDNTIGLLLEDPVFGAQDPRGLYGFPVTEITFAGNSGGPANEIEVLSAEGFRVGDTVRINGGGPAGSLYEGTIATILRGPASYFVQMVEPFGTMPSVGALMGAHRIGLPANALRADVDAFGVMMNNLLVVAFEDPNLVEREPPVQVRLTTNDEIKVEQFTMRPPITVQFPFLVQTFANAGSEIDAGVYSYRFKWRDTELQLSEESALVTGVTAGISVAAGFEVRINIGFNNLPRVWALEIYRSPTNQSDAGPWYFIGEVANVAPGPLTFVDIFSDAQVQAGRQMREFRDFGPPEGTRYVSTWPDAQRLIAIVSPGGDAADYLAFSDATDLETGAIRHGSWPTDNTLFVSYDDGDKLLGIAPFFGAIIVFKERSIWRITGIPDSEPGAGDGTLRIEPMNVRPDGTGIGAIAPLTTAQDTDELIFAARDGVYMINRYEGDVSGFSTRRLSSPIELIFPDTSFREIAERMVAAYSRPFRQYRLTQANNKVLVYQFEGNLDQQSSGWSQWEIELEPQGSTGIGQIRRMVTVPVEGLILLDNFLIGHEDDDGAIHDQVVVFSMDGAVAQMDVGASDWGTVAYEVLARTTPTAFAGRGMAARARALDVVASARGDATLITKIISNELATVESLPLAVAGAVAIFADLGWDLYAQAQVEQYLRRLSSVPGEYHQIEIREQSLTSMWSVHVMTLHFQQITKPAVRVSALPVQLPDLRSA